jgi:hypothetical protein
MRRPIETAPKDGTAVVLEDEAKGTYELARWSAEECAWVSKNGKAHEITPMYWHPVQRAEHLEGESPSQTGTSFPQLGTEPQQTPALAHAFAPPPVAASSEPANVLGPDKKMPPGKAPPSQARRRFAASCGAAMVAVALTGMYFRSDVAAYVAQHGDRADELGAGSTPQGALLEQPRKISLARPQTQADVGSEPASAAQVTVGKAPTQNPDNRRPADARESELLEARQALAESQKRETELKKAAETARTELQQSLDRIATLENELASARPQINQAPVSSRRPRRIPQGRPKQPNPQGFFGIFNVAPMRAPVQHSARAR